VTWALHVVHFGETWNPDGGRVGRARLVEEWHPVCRLVELESERGATALVHGQAVALFRTRDDQVHALGNHDPFDRSSFLARGIVGTREDVPFVVSPTLRHAFDLRTGRCLDDAEVGVPVYDVRVIEGMVLVGPRRRPEG
jgi:nitrite reductase (NADH) small subunit